MWEDGFTLPDDLSCLDGFRIYIGLLNRIWDRNWKHRLDTAMARLRGRMVTPTWIHSRGLTVQLAELEVLH